MPLIAYVDESGTASLTTIESRAPVFGLGFLVCDSERYANEIVPAVTRLKIDTFGHDAVILHAAEMRNRTGDFAVLLNAQKREAFFDALNAIILSAPFDLIAIAIRKRDQLADICVSPIAKFADTMKSTLPFEIARKKILDRPGWQNGLKIFP